jgi:menaquinone-specific isochorismate synthase
MMQSALGAETTASDLAVFTIAAPLLAPEALLRALPHEDAVLWQPPQGPAWSGVGVAHVIEAAGPQRFNDVTEQARALWSRLRREAGATAASAPRLFGGFAFKTGGASAPPWSEFGDARFVLPKVTYARDAREASLSLVATGHELSTVQGRQRVAAELVHLVEVLTRSGGAPAEHGARAPELVAADDEDEAQWVDQVEQVRSAIARGSFEKVVLAQCSTLRLHPAPDPVAILDALRAQAPECTRFAFRRGAATFLGATPERLVQKRQLQLGTEAVAGSIRSGGSESRSALRQSEKDRLEHDIVVREILRQITPLATEIDYPREPEIRELRHVLHLATRIEAKLREPCHVLELVERLHPTPAVGGLPRGAAVSWISDHEQHARGWYSGPIGWFDREGDGEFQVALRSGVLAGGTAHLYAGAGIVRDSNATREYAEARLKLSALQAALGVRS